MLFKVITRDWKSSYDIESIKSLKDMILIGTEDDVNTESDCYVTIFGSERTNITPQ